VHAPPPEDPRVLGAHGSDGVDATGHADATGGIVPPVGVPADAALPLLLADLRCRLGPACRGWSEAAFEALILEIALRKMRWGEAAKPH
jgi:hypothetical protein